VEKLIIKWTKGEMKGDQGKNSLFWVKGKKPGRKGGYSSWQEGEEKKAQWLSKKGYCLPALKGLQKTPGRGRHSDWAWHYLRGVVKCAIGDANVMLSLMP